MKTPQGAFNTWDGFDAERLAKRKDSSVSVEAPSGSAVDSTPDWGLHPSVLKIVEFHTTLLGATNAEYMLDWCAQMYQYPAQKTGIAIVLKGAEGVGKNRLTDMHREIMGRGKFMQTSTPGATLYGRSNRQREGKILIVINESNGASNDIIRDMITCDEFRSEGKGTNSYPMSCCARFIFTSNDGDSLGVKKLPVDIRRYEMYVSSALKGDTRYLGELSEVTDDPASMYAFYRFLMSRDVSGIDWTRRPEASVSNSMSVEDPESLSYESRFIRSLVSSIYQKSGLSERPDSPISGFLLSELYVLFGEWMSVHMSRVVYAPTRAKFGMCVTLLVDPCVRGNCARVNCVRGVDPCLRGLTKSRCGRGVVYRMDVRALHAQFEG